MELKDKLELKGKIIMKLYDKDNKLKEERIIENLIVTAGKNFVASWLAADSQAGKFMSYMAVGTGTTPPASADTTLEAEIARVTGTLTANNNVWQNTALFDAGVGTGNISEIGLFSAAAVGTMMARQIISPVVPKGATDKIEWSWQLTLG